jgi:hypothetical protein
VSMELEEMVTYQDVQKRGSQSIWSKGSSFLSEYSALTKLDSRSLLSIATPL